ncbi:unnamed protein product [Camellia sinensis]
MASSALTLKKTGSEGGSSESGAGTEERGRFEFFGWVYHFRVNSIGHEYYHLRFLFIRGKYVEMYKRDPREYPDIKGMVVVRGMRSVHLLRLNMEAYSKGLLLER